MIKNKVKHQIRKDWYLSRFKTYTSIAEYYDVSIDTVKKFVRDIDKKDQQEIIKKGIEFKTLLNKILLDEDYSSLFRDDVNQLLVNKIKKTTPIAEYQIESILKVIANNPNVVKAKKSYEEQITLLLVQERDEAKETPVRDKIKNYFEDSKNDK